MPSRGAKPPASSAQPPQDADEPGESRISDTPFARVLTAWMWSKQPPWSAARTAAALGMGRQRVANWIYGGVEPEMGTMMRVLEQLHIPVRMLIEAYAEDAAADASSAAPAGTAGGTGGTALDAATLASMEERLARGATARRVSGATGGVRLSPEEVERREWETMIAHTRTVMADAGFPAATINAMLAEVAQRHLGALSSAQSRVAEEQGPPTQRDDDDASADEADNPRPQHGRNPRGARHDPHASPNR